MTPLDERSLDRPAPSRRVVFLDKDGTLIENVPFNADPARIRFTAEAEDGLRLLHSSGYELVVVTNQCGIARGVLDEDDMARIEKTLRRLLSTLGVPLAGFYYCPHDPDGCVPRYARNCACRKPQPGMILAAARDLGIDLRGSWMIGDILDDVEAGRRAGLRTILLDTGNETEWRMTGRRTPDHAVGDMGAAARLIALADTRPWLHAPLGEKP